MAKCPNCEKDIPDTVQKCPYCHSNILATSSNRKFVVHQIPLKVKKAIKNNTKKSTLKDSKIELPILKEDKIPLEFLSTIKIVSTIILLCITIALIINISIELKNNKATVSETNTSIVKTTNSELGTWKTENNSLFVFDDDNVFYWYDSYLNSEDNYYAGIYTYSQGEQALTDMGYTTEEFYQTFGEEIELDEVYSILLQPSTVIKDKEDTSSKDLSENETWWFILIKTSDKEAIGYNKTLDIRYNLINY